MSGAVDVRQWIGDQLYMYGAKTNSRAKCEAVYAAVVGLIEANEKLIADCGDEYEDGEWRALDAVRTALATCGGAK